MGNTISEKTCKTCEWFLPKQETSPMNLCRRYPPIPVHTHIKATGEIGVHFSFSVISGDNSCGEHKHKEPTPSMTDAQALKVAAEKATSWPTIIHHVAESAEQAI